jgi:hypothetical protein
MGQRSQEQAGRVAAQPMGTKQGDSVVIRPCRSSPSRHGNSQTIFASNNKTRNRHHNGLNNNNGRENRKNSDFGTPAGATRDPANRRG